MDIAQLPECLESGRKRKIVPWCMICGEVPERGICGGMKLNRHFLCHECETLLINTPIGSETYHRMMEGMRHLFKHSALANRCMENE